ncbi:unnamed protein product [Tuber aestivum]|uniref:Uncharacterized protein n=1 Tax=Tuber aestivum TaxID=59557 RepID=A0A292PSM6_9PEZI|nr:unnamed protein product [Tuber aestivum]
MVTTPSASICTRNRLPGTASNRRYWRVSARKPNSQWVEKRVFLIVGPGWDSSPEGLETSPCAILGRTKHTLQGTPGKVLRQVVMYSSL